MTVLIHGYIHPVDAPDIPEGFVAFDGDKLTAVGSMAELPDGLEGQRIDLQGAHVCPGFIDAHCHLGLFGSGLGFEAEDCNEATDPVTPHLRALDAVNPLDRYFADARAAGITTVLTLPGSANAICGQGVVMKTMGSWVDDMLLLAPACMKFALGENPKTTYSDRKESPVTRMATAALIREALSKAVEYRNRQSASLNDPEEEVPEYDAKLEALLPVLAGELPAHFHAHRADDIATALRISREFGLKAVIVHATEGHRIPELLERAGVSVITGPSLCDRSKPELTDMRLDTPFILSQRMPAAICTDHPVIPIQYLPVCAALAVRGGMSQEDALAAITLIPARILEVEDRVGSITPGKDADLTIFPIHPFDWRCKGPSMVFLNGQLITEAAQ